MICKGLDCPVNGWQSPSTHGERSIKGAYMTRSLPLSLLGGFFLFFALTAHGLTVEGPVSRATDNAIVVDGTHFLVDGETMVELAPAQRTEEGAGRRRPYDPAHLDDAASVRVKGVGRRAEVIRVLPYEADPQGERGD
ncbi:hypothetical protein [Thiohalorhabdus methylotrophus]|uniref:DUF5666 domain-containing protein n=1 Tax=Thiohalorhabdus methylotrophus TaxID=3242694 RepID=A0ABV4TWX5_9GAMM